MADFLTPILEEFQTILQANLNTEIDNIDNTLTDVKNAAIVIEDFDLSFPEFPWLQVFPRPGENQIDSDQQNLNIVFNFDVITALTIAGKDSTELTKNLSKYMSAMLISIIKGTGSDRYSLNGVVNLVRPIGWGHEDFINQETSETVKGGFIVWRTVKDTDPLS